MTQLEKLKQIEQIAYEILLDSIRAEHDVRQSDLKGVYVDDKDFAFRIWKDSIKNIEDVNKVLKSFADLEAKESTPVTE